MGNCGSADGAPPPPRSLSGKDLPRFDFKDQDRFNRLPHESSLYPDLRIQPTSLHQPLSAVSKCPQQRCETAIGDGLFAKESGVCGACCRRYCTEHLSKSREPGTEGVFECGPCRGLAYEFHVALATKIEQAWRDARMALVNPAEQQHQIKNLPWVQLAELELDEMVQRMSRVVRESVVAFNNELKQPFERGIAEINMQKHKEQLEVEHKKQRDDFFSTAEAERAKFVETMELEIVSVLHRDILADMAKWLQRAYTLTAAVEACSKSIIAATKALRLMFRDRATSKALLTQPLSNNNNNSQETTTTFLHIASAAGSLQVVRFLVDECEVPVDITDSNNRTPLHVAVSSLARNAATPPPTTHSFDPRLPDDIHHDVILFLCARGANPSALDCDNKPAVNTACPRFEVTAAAAGIALRKHLENKKHKQRNDSDDSKEEKKKQKQYLKVTILEFALLFGDLGRVSTVSVGVGNRNDDRYELQYKSQPEQQQHDEQAQQEQQQLDNKRIGGWNPVNKIMNNMLRYPIVKRDTDRLWGHRGPPIAPIHEERTGFANPHGELNNKFPTGYGTVLLPMSDEHMLFAPFGSSSLWFLVHAHSLLTGRFNMTPRRGHHKSLGEWLPYALSGEVLEAGTREKRGELWRMKLEFVYL